MANFNKYISKLIKHEGGYVDHKDDRGGATNIGITLATWRTYGRDLDGDGDIDKDDVRLITEAEAIKIYKSRYWDDMWGDRIINQDIAEIMYDHGVNAGMSRAVKMVQELINRLFNYKLVVDGVFGNNTLKAINSVDNVKLFEAFKKMRSDYYHYLANESDREAQFFSEKLRIGQSDRQKVFLKGWLNRVASFVSSNPAKSSAGVIGLILGVFF